MAPASRFKSRRTLAPQPTPPGLYRSTCTPELGAAICRRAASLAAQGERDAARRAAVEKGKRAAWNAGWDGYHPHIDGMICARLMGGMTLAQVCEEPWAPSVGTVYNWLRRYPEFLANYRRAKARAPDIMVGNACEGLPWIGERKSWPMLRRVVRESDKRAARLSLKRYAPPEGPRALTVMAQATDGSVAVIYDGRPPAAGGAGCARPMRR